MPARDIRPKTTSAPLHELPSTSPLPSIPEYDTYKAAGTLEDGPQSGDKDPEFVKYPLLEDPISEESTPFLQIEEKYNRGRVSTLLSRCTPSWRTRRRSYRRKTNNNGKLTDFHGRSSQYTQRRRPSLFRCTCYLLGATLMLL